jgi:methylisocitrate lyase
VPMSTGWKFRKALAEERPLQIIGTVNAYVAIMAERAGYRALYLSGAGVANNSYGLPDLGLTTLDQVVADVERITSAVGLPLLVDVDTGWNDIAETVERMNRAGASALQIEDQVPKKRCGHRPGKQVVPLEEMAKRLETAVLARKDPSLLIMARCDAFQMEGIRGVIERARAYEEAGADLFFPEALGSLSQYHAIKEAIGIPVLANLTEFGVTPLFTTDELSRVGIDMALYPLSVTRAMNRAAEKVLREIRTQGTQERMVRDMQTRDESYHYLRYQEHEEQQ